MKKTMLLGVGLTLCVIMLCSAQVYATPVTLVEQGAEWQYDVLSTDLWPNWGAAGYGSFDWNNATWATGNAAFGNPYSLPYNTEWVANTDLALQKSFEIDGPLLGDVTLNVASDNGFIVFINGQQVAKEIAEGYTSYWEYTFNINSSPFFAPGSNVIQVLAEDHGGATFFDLELTGNVVPEPGTVILLGVGLLGLFGFKRRMKK